LQYDSEENKTVVLTRQTNDNIRLKKLLVAKGIAVIEAPCFEIAYIAPTSVEKDALLGISEFDAIIFSSKNGVAGFFTWLESQPELRGQGRPRIVAAVGPKTAKVIGDKNWQVDLVADPATGEEMATRLLEKITPGARVLAIRGNTSRDAASKKLAEKGCKIFPLTVYENREPYIDTILEDYQAVVYTSPMGAKRFLEANPHAKNTAAIAIGTTTEKFLKSINMKVTLAENTDENALLEAVCKAIK